MKESLPSLLQLLKQLQYVPYIASRHIYRVAHYFLEMQPEKLESFCTALKEAHKQLIKCGSCFAWREQNRPCLFCGNAKRQQHLICVVETWYDMWAIERTESYQGIYHVLGGAICPLDGVGPEDLTINDLVTRVATRAPSEAQCEIILALNQTPEGEATSAYIARKLENLPVTITCLARGVPVGSSLESLDRLTVHKALNERRPF